MKIVYKSYKIIDAAICQKGSRAGYGVRNGVHHDGRRGIYGSG